MIGYVTLGSDDIPRAAAFYDALFAVIGATRQWESDKSVAWSTAPDQPTLCVNKPFDGKPATVGNGSMVSFYVTSAELVAALYNKAIELGGQDEGAPGPRGTTGFYGAYFRDLDGNKLAAFTMLKA